MLRRILQLRWTQGWLTRSMVAVVIAVSTLNRWVGAILSWLSLAIVLVCFILVVQRYLFATSYLWMQDLYVWLNGAMFTGVAGYALFRNDHVRVDIFYRPASTTAKALIDLCGVVLFLLPFCCVIWVYGWPFVARSWRIHEASAIAGGMPGLFVLKSFILLFAGLLTLQGVAIALRGVLILTGREHHLRA